MYAVIETGSKQYRVEVGTELQVELLDVEPGETITLDRVLLVADGDSAAIGQPTVDGATVSAEVLRRDRGEKLIAFKYRPKARRRVKKGHRQELTVLRVADIVFGGKSAAEAAKKAQAAAKTERQRLEEAAARQAAEDAALAAKLAKAAEPKTMDGTDATSGKAGKSGARADKASDGAGKGTKAAGSARRGTGTSTGEPKAQGTPATRTTGPTKAGGRTTEKKDGPSGPAPRRGSRPKKDD
jgi:large subunit ribosomal protein L21